jgi:hypothetical protein
MPFWKSSLSEKDPAAKPGKKKQLRKNLFGGLRSSKNYGGAEVFDRGFSPEHQSAGLIVAGPNDVPRKKEAPSPAPDTTISSHSGFESWVSSFSPMSEHSTAAELDSRKKGYRKIHTPGSKYLQHENSMLMRLDDLKSDQGDLWNVEMVVERNITMNQLNRLLVNQGTQFILIWLFHPRNSISSSSSKTNTLSTSARFPGCRRASMRLRSWPCYCSRNAQVFCMASTDSDNRRAVLLRRECWPQDQQKRDISSFLSELYHSRQVL